MIAARCAEATAAGMAGRGKTGLVSSRQRTIGVNLNGVLHTAG